MSALQKSENSVCSPLASNCCSSSISNQLGGNVISATSPSTTLSPTTTALQTHNNSLNTSTNAAIGCSLGHKNSLKGTKLARRARSFKDDLFEKISLMRTPTNTLGRPHSPHSPRSKNMPTKPPPTAEEMAKSSQSLETHVKDISNALKHFRDVILKKKLEVLPGNGTVILETIASMYAVIQSYTLNENSTIMLSATQQVYQSLGKLIKLCDEVMLSDDANDCASLSNENVKEVVDLLEVAVRNLVSLAQQKLKEKEENTFEHGSPSVQEGLVISNNNNLMRPPTEVAGQRTSLPDITLTPKERDILEKTKTNPMRASHSTESILRDTSPPPKPPLPNRSTHPPPLPPKRRNQQLISNNISMNSDLDCSSDFSLINYGGDYLSVRSRSPDENSSQCSLDSALNHSREEDELKALVMENRPEGNVPESEAEKIFTLKNQVDDNLESTLKNNLLNRNNIGDCGVIACNSTAAVTATMPTIAGVVAAATEKSDPHKTTNYRHSNESGFASMKSFRSSTQSVSKRSSEYSFQSSTKSSNANLNVRNSTETECLMAVETIGHEDVKQELTNDYFATATTSTVKEHETPLMSSATTTTAYSNIRRICSSAIAITGDGTRKELEKNHLLNNNALGSSPTENVDCTDELLINQLIKGNSLDISSSDDLFSLTTDLIPPALPPKTKFKERHLSQYDNFDDLDNINNLQDMAELRPHPPNNQISSLQWQTKHQSLIEPRHMGSFASSCNAIGSESGIVEEPPPLPIKKKHILAYMEICSASTRSIEQHRHTMHTYNLNRNITHSQTMNIVPVTKGLNSPDEDEPPALPPKNYKQRRPPLKPMSPPTIITTPPPSPKLSHMPGDTYSEGGSSLRHGREIMSTVCEELADLSEEEHIQLHQSHNLPNDADTNSATKSYNVQSKSVSAADITNEEDEGIDIALEENTYNNKKECSLSSSLTNEHPNLLEEIDITPYLILKKESEDGPEVKGGYIDALIVHAIQKISDNAFSEAFITTFRTFIQPIDVIEKLTHRYTVFFCQLNDLKQKAAKETFSLLVRVVNDLTSVDLTNQLLTLLVEFVYQLVCSGQLYLAKLLRNKIVEKVTLYKEQKYPYFPANMHVTVSNQPSLLDLKSVEIAEQMTLLDAELFQKIEIPEVLLFAKEQCEEKSPNLNKFTEHFNKMSYWARSKILMLPDAKERERHVIKFIKIMKHLRKINNYNSYLALLSALDSAPIRRLEWHKTITEGLKEYCTLIDSSSSFRIYRQALAETNPPCIPYIGLVLQDLTFVHVGNPDYIRDGIINFSKRWQQHNIIVNMKRFKKCAYPFRRNERIIRFFENFENFLGEEEMWQISETIKPRGKKSTQN